MEVYFTYILDRINKKHFLTKNKIFFRLFPFLVFTCLAFASSLMSCAKEKNAKGILPDTSIYSKINYSPMLLDSSILANFYTKNKIDDSLKIQIDEFYSRRNFQFAWFNQNGITSACHIYYNQLMSFSEDFQDKSLNSELVDSLINVAHIENKEYSLPIGEMRNIELLLTTSFFKYAQKAYGGIEKNLYDLEWFIPRKRKNFQVLLDSLVSSNSNFKAQEPVNHFYIKLKEKLKTYKKIEKTGGLPLITTLKKQVVLGEKDTCLVSLKKYLFITGDLRKSDTSQVFNDSLKTALTRFQRRFGLTDNGILNKGTIDELNVPLEARIRQIMVNLERLRWLPDEIEADYFFVNIPEFRLHVFEDNKEVSTSKVVVGKTATKTSIFKGSLSTIVLNPSWGVPKSIVVNEILPKLKSSTSYLTRNNMEVYLKNKVIDPTSVNWSKYSSDVPYSFKQKPGSNNSLGKIKFLFPNNFDIYLHDTPSKSLFSQTQRAFSHGCIRVENPKKLAQYVLKNDKKWTSEKIEETLLTDKETRIEVKPKIPVYIVYLTAWVDGKGGINFRKDLYQFDEKLASEIFGEPK